MTFPRRAALLAACIATLLVTTAPAAETPVELRADVAKSDFAGTLLMLYQLTAEVARDALARDPVAGKDPRVQGWLVELKGKKEGVLVTFIGDEGGAPLAL